MAIQRSSAADPAGTDSRYLGEAVALTLGKNPELVTWSSLEAYIDVDPLAVHFARLRRRVLRAKDAQQLTDPISPKDYFAWAHTNGVAIPPRLKKSVDASQGPARDWKDLYEAKQPELESFKDADKAVGGKERNTFNKMVLGMAIRGYGYPHLAARSRTAKDIANDLAALGIPLDEDTVRARLREAGDEYGHLVPPLDD